MSILSPVTISPDTTRGMTITPAPAANRLTVVNCESAPAAIGPYNHAVKHGNLVYTSGQIGINPQTKALVSDSVTEQAETALTNLQKILEASGSCLQNVIKTTVFLTDMNDFPSANTVYSRFFGEASGGHKPARSCVQVAALPAGAKFEIEAIAAVMDAQMRISNGDERSPL